MGDEEEMKSKVDAGETKPLEPKNRQAKTATAKAVPPPASLMPFYMIVLCLGGALYQYAEMKVSTLREAERNWDPRPRNMADNEVIIMYCNG